MTLTELQLLRGYLGTVIESKEKLYEVWLFGEGKESVNRRLEAINKHLEIVEQEIYNLAVKTEKSFINH